MPKKKLNVVVFAVDSLRADHMDCYGYPRQTFPHVGRLVKGGVLFENAYSAYIPTTPAYTTMLTGRDVMSTGIVALGPKGPIPPEIPTLPEVLGEEGYSSACVGFGPGFYRGFDRYETYRSWMSWEERPGDKADALNEVAIPILDELSREEPFLLFLRHMDPHAPYLPPKPFDTMFYSKDPCDPKKKTMKKVFDFKPFAEFFKSWMPPGVTDWDYVVAQYDGALAYMDACIQRIFTRLEELGVMEDTLIVLNADHGETLTEHEIYFDHHGLYEPTTHVPLLLYCPSRLPSSLRVPGFVLHQDLMPTLLELVGLKRRVKGLGMDGQSVLPLIQGKRHTNYSEFLLTECTWMRKRGWRTPAWKLIKSLEPDFHQKPEVELYNLIEDPGENRNLANKKKEVVQLLTDRMMSWIEKRMEETGRGDPILEYEIGLDKRIGSVRKAKELQDTGKKKGS